VSCAAALAVLDVIESDKLLEHVEELGAGWKAALSAVTAPLLLDVRGRGLWLALAVEDGSAPAIEQAAREAGFLVNAVAPDAVRLAPPLILTQEEARAFTDALPAILDSAAAAIKVGEESRPGTPDRKGSAR